MPTSKQRQRARDTAVRKQRARRYHERERLLRTATVEEITSKITAEQHQLMAATADAEAEGDAAEALRLYSQIPAFEGSLHGERLEVLAGLGNDAPAWLWSRWMTLQVRRPVWSDEQHDGPDPSFLRAVRAAYPRGFDPQATHGLSMDVFVATLYERDWVVRQVTVYDDGGLRRFLAERAGPRLIAGADETDAWANAPMGGYRMLSDHGGVLRVVDLADESTVELLDLGLGAQYGADQHFLARIVPTVARPGRMFEWRPLPVGRGTARKVAQDPASWLEVVARRADTGLLPPLFSYQDDTDMLTDLPCHAWLAFLAKEDIPKLPRTDGVLSYDDVAIFTLQRILRVAPIARRRMVHTRQFLWPLLLRSGMDAAIRANFVGPEHARAWRILGLVLAEPARGRCRAYAALAEANAA